MISIGNTLAAQVMRDPQVQALDRKIKMKEQEVALAQHKLSAAGAGPAARNTATAKLRQLLSQLALLKKQRQALVKRKTEEMKRNKQSLPPIAVSTDKHPERRHATPEENMFAPPKNIKDFGPKRALSKCSPWSAFSSEACKPFDWKPSTYKGWTLISNRTTPFGAVKEGRRISTPKGAEALKAQIDREEAGVKPPSPDKIKRAVIEAQEGQWEQGTAKKPKTIEATKHEGPMIQKDTTPTVDEAAAKQPEVTPLPDKEKKPNYLLWGGVAAAGLFLLTR